MTIFLGFLLFLSIPVIIHLFNFKKAKPFPFTNVRFIRRISLKNQSKKNLKHYLILCTRLLAFLFLILTFFIDFLMAGDPGSNSSGSKGYYLDNSPSMTIAEERLDKVNMGANLFRSLIEANTYKKAVLVRNDFVPFSARARTQSEVLEEIGQTVTSYHSRSFSEVIDRMKHAKAQDILLYSDFQEMDEKDIETIRSDTICHYSLFVNDLTGVSNVYVDTAYFERNTENYEQEYLKCVLKNSGNEQINTVVKLIGEGGERIASIVRNIEGSVEVTFDLPKDFSDKGLEISLSGDRSTYDNSFFLQKEKHKKPSVLLMNNRPNVFLSRLFLNAQLFDLIERSPDNVDYEQIESADLLIFNGFYALPEGIIKDDDKTSFVVIPGDSIDENNYSRQLGLRFSYKETESAKQEIVIDKESFLFSGVFKSTNKAIDLPASTALFQVVGSHEKMIKLRDGSTLLGKHPLRTLYFFTTPLVEKYTHLPNHAIFLPIMYKIGEESVDASATYYTHPNHLMTLHVNDSGNPVRIIDDETEIIPEYSLRDRNCTLQIPNDLKPGFYHLIQGNDTLKQIAVNISKKESSIGDYTFEALHARFEAFDHVDVFEAGEGKSIRGTAVTGEKGLWKYALILALGFILAETMLHRFLR